MKHLAVAFVILMLIGGNNHPNYRDSILGIETLIPVLNLENDMTEIHFRNPWRYTNVLYSVTKAFCTNAYCEFIITSTGATDQKNLENSPDHYGYDTNQYIGGSYSEKMYLFFEEKDMSVSVN